jgi:uncharacterized protein YndB with AHSA1/START domain
MSTTTSPTITEATIEAHPSVPMIVITREFDATPAQLLRAHTDPDLFARWCGPDDLTMRIEHFDARRGGAYRYVHSRGENEYAFYGSFHDITDDQLVQTFTFEGMPDQVALETITFEDLGNGRTRLRAQSLCDSFEARDQWLRSGMETGVNQGYAKLDAVLAAGDITATDGEN